MKISISQCDQNDICGFGKNQKKIFRIKINKFDKEEIKLGFVSKKVVPTRKDETLPNEEDNVWLYFPIPISKNELRKILNELDKSI